MCMFQYIQQAGPRCSTVSCIRPLPPSPGSWTSPAVWRFPWRRWPWPGSCPGPPAPYPPRPAGGGSGGRCSPAGCWRRPSHGRMSCRSGLPAELCSSCKLKVTALINLCTKIYFQFLKRYQKENKGWNDTNNDQLVHNWKKVFKNNLY